MYTYCMLILNNKLSNFYFQFLSFGIIVNNIFLIIKNLYQLKFLKDDYHLIRFYFIYIEIYYPVS